MASLQSTFRKQYGKHGIYAGSSHFRDYWARDSLFACFGCLALKDYDQVKKTLDHFLENLDSSGHVPLRIGRKNPLLAIRGLSSKQGVWHTQDKGNNVSTDGNALLLIVAAAYERSTKKKLDRIKLQAVLAWLERNQKNNLVRDTVYSTWEDSIKITGPRIYSNVLHYRALRAANQLFKNKIYEEQAARTKEAIQRWWNGTYFSDGPRNHACLVAGNLLAVLWGVANKKQSEKILAHVAKRDTIVPPGGFWNPTMKQAYIPFFFVGMQDYHGVIEWSWLASLEIICYRIIGDSKEANKRQKALMGLIEKYDCFYEVYESDKPVDRFVYKSEKDFSWAIGLLIASQPSVLSCLR